MTNPVPIVVYNSTNIDPLTADYLDIYSFEVSETDNDQVRKLFLANTTTTIYTC